MSDKQKLSQLLGEQEYMVLAVTLDDGTPWTVPVRIKLQWGNAFEWESHIGTEHSKAISQRSDVAITVFKNAAQAQIGFYAQATAKLVEEYKPGFGRYQAIVTKAWLNDDTFVKREVIIGGAS